MKERLYGFTREEIFDLRSRERIRELSPGSALSFQINQLMGRLERDVEALKARVLAAAEPLMAPVDIPASVKGAGAFIATAIIADIIEAGRLKGSKRFTSYLRPAPRAANSNTTVKSRGANKMGRELSATLPPQSLNHAMSASEKLRGRHERLCERKKPGLARTGLRRRALAEIRQTLKKGGMPLWPG
ncbi:MAG: transposase [Treponema sp.]|nr:transposase [Treponema sp.]